MSEDLAAKGVRCRSARVFGGVVVATSEAGNVYRARAGAPLELLRVFADAGRCVEDAWPLTGGEILVAVASRPPAPVEAAPATPPYAAAALGRRGGAGARRADRRAGRVALRRLRAALGRLLVDRRSAARRFQPLWDAGGALPAGWHEAAWRCATRAAVPSRGAAGTWRAHPQRRRR